MLLTEADQNLLLKMVEQLRQDFADERDAARESRARTHDRIDEVVDRLGRIDTTIALSGEVDAQVRSELNQVKSSLNGMQPTVDEWVRVRTIGKWAVGLLLTGGIGVGAVFAALGDSLVTTVRHWLRIN